jgi:hypothetical protein
MDIDPGTFSASEVTGSLNERFMKSVGRHFVTLSCVQAVPGSPNEKILIFSGFLADIGGMWFYVTAGHILRCIRSALNAGATFDIWRLGDQTAGNRFKDTAIPFAFDIDLWCVIEEEEVGLDYAAVPLETMYCRALQAGGAIPIDKSAWADYVTEHDQWALVGVPSETVSYDGNTIITARVVVAPLEPVDDPVAAGPKAQNQFYGRLKDDSAAIVKDIDGMSGSPIFALKKVEETWKYSVIGVQSGWYQQRRIIAACPFSSFALALEDVVVKARLSLEGGEGSR